MALKKTETLLLPVVPVAVRGVVAGLKGIGFAQASGQTPEVPLSFARHLPPGDPDTDPHPLMRYEPANSGEAHAARRAGRSGSSAGVPDSRPLARSTRAAILSGWSVAAGGIGLVGIVWRGRLTTTATTVATDRSLPGRPQPFTRFPARRAVRPEYGHRRSLGKKCAEDGRGGPSPARGMPSASLRGR
jgi:hypothetical protein